MADKIKVVAFNSLPFEERAKLTYYIELHRMRGMEQVRCLLKDEIGKNNKRRYWIGNKPYQTVLLKNMR